MLKKFQKLSIEKKLLLFIAVLAALLVLFFAYTYFAKLQVAKAPEAGNQENSGAEPANGFRGPSGPPSTKGPSSPPPSQ